MHAAGGAAAHEQMMDELQEALGSLGRFANAVLDAYFVRRVRLLQNVHPADVPPEGVP
jgi:hypothetical protein